MARRFSREPREVNVRKELGAGCIRRELPEQTYEHGDLRIPIGSVAVSSDGLSMRVRASAGNIV